MIKMMKDDAVYNKWNNEVMVKTGGEHIYIICHREALVQPVLHRMNTDTCILSYYEEWDDNVDMKWILTFKLTNESEQLPEKN